MSVTTVTDEVKDTRSQLGRFVESHKLCEWQERLVSFFACDVKVIKRWCVDGILPCGENLLRLRFFLELHGLVPSELANLQSEVYHFAKLIAFRALSLEEAASLISSSAERSTYLLSTVLGKQISGKITLDRMRELCVPKAAILELKIAFWRSEFQLSPVLAIARNGKSTEQPPAIEKIEKSERVDNLYPTHAQLVEVLASQIKAALPLARSLASDAFTSHEREKLRELTANGCASNGVFELSNLLNRLCGEKAREMYLVK